MLPQVLEDGEHVHRAEAAGRAGQVRKDGDHGHRGVRGAARRQGAVGVQLGQHAAVGGRPDQGGDLPQGAQAVPRRRHPADRDGRGRADDDRARRLHQGEWQGGAGSSCIIFKSRIRHGTVDKLWC